MASALQDIAVQNIAALQPSASSALQPSADSITKENHVRESYIRNKGPVAELVLFYKTLKGYKLEDRDWDKANFPRVSRSCKNIYMAFDKDFDAALKYIDMESAKLDKLGLSWNYNTLERRAWDYAKEQKNQS